VGSSMLAALLSGLGLASMRGDLSPSR
jgi:hypothetical protein